MKMKLLDAKRHLDYLNLVIKEKGHTARSLALLTDDKPNGYGKMSHQTIYDILKGKTEIKYWQLQEFSKILNVKINTIISPSVNKLEIILYYNRDKGYLEDRKYDQPIEVIYCLNAIDIKPSYKALYFNNEGLEKTAMFLTIDMEHKNWCKDKKMQERLLYVPSVLHCGSDGKHYFGNVLGWNSDGTCVFQQWKRRFQCNHQTNFYPSKNENDWEAVDYAGMVINDFTLHKKAQYIAVYPQITSSSLFDEDFKIEKISI